MMPATANALLIGILGGWLYGYNTGIIGGLGKQLIVGTYFSSESTEIQDRYQGFLTAEILLGAFLGSFVSVPLANQYGRRCGLMVCGAIGLVTALLLAIVDSFGSVVLVRTLLGLAVGFTGTLCPLYVNEVSPVSVRGQLGTVFQISICATILIAQIVNYAFNPSSLVNLPAWKWHLQFGLGSIPGGLLLVASRIVPESPAFEQQKRQLDTVHLSSSAADRNQQTAGQLNRYSSTGEMTSKSKSMLNLFRWINLKWVFIGVILAMGNQLTGINAIIFYSPSIFEAAGAGNPMVMQFTVVGVWNLVTVFISFLLVDRLGRRPLMLASLACMCVACLAMGLAYSVLEVHKAPIAIFAIMLYIGAFECGPGPLFFLLACETFPSHVQKPALGLANGIAWSFNILVTFLFPVVKGRIGPAATFIVFCVICAICLTLVFFYLPETKQQVNKEAEKQSGYKPLEAGEEEVVAGVLGNKL